MLIAKRLVRSKRAPARHRRSKLLNTRRSPAASTIPGISIMDSHPPGRTLTSLSDLWANGSFIPKNLADSWNHESEGRGGSLILGADLDAYVSLGLVRVNNCLVKVSLMWVHVGGPVADCCLQGKGKTHHETLILSVFNYADSWHLLLCVCHVCLKRRVDPSSFRACAQVRQFV